MEVQQAGSMTHDTLFEGNLVCSQPAQGYRFSVDPVLLAHFCHPRKEDKILDLGAGCGILGLILAYRYPWLRITGIELQKQLVDCAIENIHRNDLHDRLAIIQGNYRVIGSLVRAESFNQVILNPPYRKIGSGRRNPDSQQAVARHELHGGIGDAVGAAAYAVKNRGLVSCVFPAIRLAELIASLHEYKLTPSRLRPVFSYPESRSAVLVLLEAVKNGCCETQLLAPLFIYKEKNGPYSDEVAGYYYA